MKNVFRVRDKTLDAVCSGGVWFLIAADGSIAAEKPEFAFYAELYNATHNPPQRGWNDAGSDPILSLNFWEPLFPEAFATLCLLTEAEPPFKVKRDGKPINFEVETLVEKAWNPNPEPKFKNAIY